MSTESHAPPDVTSPGAAVRATWTRFKRGELLSYRVMAVLLLVATGIGLLIYMQGQTKVADSKKWLDLETAGTLQDLEKVVTDYPNSVPAQIAEVHLARFRLGPEGIDRLVTGDDLERKKALTSIESAQETFTKLAPEVKDSPVLQAECYLGLAKAEVALIGITKEGRIDDFRGSPTRAAEWLEKLAGVGEGTPWGEEAKKTAADLRKPGGTLTQDIIRVQTNLYNMALFPSRPGGGMPFGPGGGMPFGPGGLPPGFPMGGPMGGIPGLPGGMPLPPGGMPLPPGHP